MAQESVRIRRGREGWRSREEQSSSMTDLGSWLSLGEAEETQAPRGEIVLVLARWVLIVVGMALYMLSLNLEKAADLAPPSESADGLRGLVGLAKASLLEVRQYIFDLKPLLSGEAGLVDALRNQAREFTAVSAVPVDLKVSGKEALLPMEVSTSLYRIAQEALANAFRHADASHVSLSLSFEPGSVTLRISDDGRGFAQGRDGGHGLGNMRQRTEELGGSFEVESEKGVGTSVFVGLPLSSPAATVDVSLPASAT